jgi:Collagen triple helix repeat (20 copies)
VSSVSAATGQINSIAPCTTNNCCDQIAALTARVSALEGDSGTARTALQKAGDALSQAGIAKAQADTLTGEVDILQSGYAELLALVGGAYALARAAMAAAAAAGAALSGLSATIAGIGATLAGLAAELAALTALVAPLLVAVAAIAALALAAAAAQTLAQSAYDLADTALRIAGSAGDLAATAILRSNAAQAAADAANRIGAAAGDLARAAQSTADRAISAASGAQGTADRAIGAAAAADSKATVAGTAAAAADSKATVAGTAAAAADSKATVAGIAAAAADSKATVAGTAAATADSKAGTAINKADTAIAIATAAAARSTVAGLPGAKGDRGEQGIQGVAGAAGNPGLAGIPGATGTPGSIGAQGFPGVAGTPGRTGAQGLPGASADPTLPIRVMVLEQKMDDVRQRPDILPRTPDKRIPIHYPGTGEIIHVPTDDYIQGEFVTENNKITKLGGDMEPLKNDNEKNKAAILAIQQNCCNTEPKTQPKVEFAPVLLKKFERCDPATGKPVFSEEPNIVIKEMVLTERLKSEKIADIQAQQCKDCGCVASVPEWWQLRPEAQRPQGILIFKELKDDGTIGNDNYSITIPHCTLTTAPTASPLTTYNKGDFEGILTLKDNSKLIVNCKDADECNRVITALSAVINSQQLTGSSTKIGQRKGLPFKKIKVKAVELHFYPTGLKSMKPVYFKRFQ